MEKTPLKLKIVKDTEAQEYCVAALRHHLARAERGEILGIAIATADTDQYCTYDHAGNNGFRLLGALEMVKTSMVRKLMET